MSKFECNKKDPCVDCGTCCHFREEGFLSDEEDFKIKGQLYLKTGIIYLYPFSRYTITINKEEKNRLEKSHDGLKVLPKKIFYDADHDRIYILDYFLDYDICPMWKDNRCSVYSIRPEICKQFPNITMEHNVDIEKLIGHKQIRLLNLKYEDIQEVIKIKLKDRFDSKYNRMNYNTIKNMIKNNKDSDEKKNEEKDGTKNSNEDERKNDESNINNADVDKTYDDNSENIDSDNSTENLNTKNIDKNTNIPKSHNPLDEYMDELDKYNEGVELPRSIKELRYEDQANDN